jgi:AraC-like DNA-binding protein/quercetin dioxygenase-like cupin family protein
MAVAGTAKPKKGESEKEPKAGMSQEDRSRNLSRALSGLHLVSAKWATIALGSGWGFSLDSDSSVFSVHFVLDGEVYLSCAHGKPMRIVAGESAILATGAAHTVRSDPQARLLHLKHVGRDEGSAASPFEGEDSPDYRNIGVSRVDSAAAVVLSGQIGLTWPADLLPPRELLPTVIEGTPGYRNNKEASEQAVTSLREMAGAPGGTICLARFAHLLITRRLREQVLQEPALVSENPRSSVAIARVVQAIRLEPGRQWSVSNLASHAGMSRSGFAEKFRIETGQTPMEVVTQARMEMAVRLLRHSREAIKSISASTGYSSSPVFIRTFRRHFGQSPSAYRTSDPKA